MSDPHPEQLLGYLLEALEEPERELLKERLEKDPELRGRLARIRRSLGPLAVTKRDFSPPPGLAARTCEFVVSRSQQAAGSGQQAAGSGQQATGSGQRAAGSGQQAATCCAPIGAEAPSPERTGGWGWQDLAVAATVVLATTMLIFPAILSSRFNARVTACQDNLRELGMALDRYSQKHRGYFPRVPAQGRLAMTGIYAPALLDGGFLTDQRRVLCPGSPAAEQPDFEVPPLHELESAGQEQLARMLPSLASSYGYGVGYRTEDGQYHDIRNLRRANYGLMADVPSPNRPGYQSDNHGGRGQNVLFENNSVRFLTTSSPTELGDDLFVNERGEVAPGQHRDDAVIVGPGMSVPILDGSGW